MGTRLELVGERLVPRRWWDEVPEGLAHSLIGNGGLKDRVSGKKLGCLGTLGRLNVGQPLELVHDNKA